MLRYTTNCCDMIAMKREVAAYVHENIWQVFRGANVKLGNWRQVTVQSNKRCVDAADTGRRDPDERNGMTHTEECTVTACRTYS